MKQVNPLCSISRPAKTAAACSSLGRTSAFQSAKFTLRGASPSASPKMPRQVPWTTCTCGSMKPGCTTPPPASIIRRARYFGRMLRSGPTALMRRPVTATAPFARTRRPASMVITVPLVISRSHRTPCAGTLMPLPIAAPVYGRLARPHPLPREPRECCHHRVEIDLELREVRVSIEAFLVHVELAVHLDLEAVAVFLRTAVAADELDAFVGVVDPHVVAAPGQEP